MTTKNNFREAMIEGYRLCDQFGYTPEWYAEARDQVAKFAAEVAPDKPVEYVSGIIAITSAQCTVKENFRRAYAYLTTGSVLGIPFMTKQCDKYTENYIYNDDPTIYGSDGNPTPKTNEFRQNICPVHGDDNRITVDRHIFHIAGGETIKHRTKSIQWIEELSSEYGLTPSTVQALVWFSVKWNKGDRAVGSGTKKCPFSPFLIFDWLCENHELAVA